MLSFDTQDFQNSAENGIGSILTLVSQFARIQPEDIKSKKKCIAIIHSILYKKNLVD